VNAPHVNRRIPGWQVLLVLVLLISAVATIILLGPRR